MLLKNNLVKKCVQCVRLSSTSTKKETLAIHRTTYKTDDWTNISSRFQPFVGANLYLRRNHPLRQTQEEVIAFFQKWFNQNVDSTVELPVYKNLDPLEANTSTEKDPNAFYVNRDLVLRSHALNREIKYLKTGQDNFLMIIDLYRRCKMDAMHFPAFHRLNFIRAQNQSHSIKILKDEHDAALVEMARHFLGNSVKYRWTLNKSTTTDPSQMFEIWHEDEWRQISSAGSIRNEIFERSDRPNDAGWEIAVSLDHFAMILYKIFDIRLLWNSDQTFLEQFQPQKISEKLQTKLIEDKKAGKVIPDAVKKRPTLESDVTFNPKKTGCKMNVSFMLPPNMDLESFPTDELCNYILKNSNSAAQQVDVYDTFFHPTMETYVINLTVVYKLGQNRTKREIKNIHESVRAHAANNFNLSLRL